jgi:hypothetical protein
VSTILNKNPPIGRGPMHFITEFLDICAVLDKDRKESRSDSGQLAQEQHAELRAAGTV